MIKLYTMALKTSNPWYDIAARVLARSVKRNSPESQLNVHDVEVPRALEELRAESNRPTTALVSAAKMQWQNEVVQETEDGELIGFLDADMLCLRELEPIVVAIGDCDLCITTSVVGNRFAWNTGVVFVRVSDHSKSFYHTWYHAAVEMMQDRRLHNQYRSTYGGVSQSSLAHVLQNTTVGCATTVAPVKTSEWNALNVTHRQEDANPRLVHIVGSLRKTLQLNGAVRNDDPLGRYALIWKQLEAESR